MTKEAVVVARCHDFFLAEVPDPPYQWPRPLIPWTWAGALIHSAGGWLACWADASQAGP
jgi:hypothetical protein